MLITLLITITDIDSLLSSNHTFVRSVDLYHLISQESLIQEKDAIQRFIRQNKLINDVKAWSLDSKISIKCPFAYFL
jgi:hypothetical protein